MVKWQETQVVALLDKWQETQVVALLDKWIAGSHGCAWLSAQVGAYAGNRLGRVSC